MQYIPMKRRMLVEQWGAMLDLSVYAFPGTGFAADYHNQLHRKH